MRLLLIAVLLSATSTWAQDKPADASNNSKTAKGQVTLQGCVTRLNGDYILLKQDPGVSYELQAGSKIKLHSFLGQQVEVTGQKSASLSNSSDAESRSASPVTITVTSIKTISAECPAH
jgi:hypothetical protein